jgi:hypothetical protein
MPTVEQALVARAGLHVLAARAKESLKTEARAGCRPDLASCPVQLGPPFRDLVSFRNSRLGPAIEPSPL